MVSDINPSFSEATVTIKLCVEWSKLTSHPELQRTYTKQTLKELQMYRLSGFASDMEFKECS